MGNDWQVLGNRFDILHWDACSGEIRTVEQWCDTGCSVFDDELRYKVSQNPVLVNLQPRQKRRLSSISKLTLDVALGAMLDVDSKQPDSHPVSTVFTSRSGEVGRMAGLLESICSGDAASPTDFSLSVHNTTSGLFSIITGSQQQSTAVSSGYDSLIAGLIEAACQLYQQKSPVLLVVFEDSMPEIYQSFSVKDEYPIAAAFLLSPGSRFQMSVNGNSESGRVTSIFNQLRALIDSVANKTGIEVTGERMSCKIEAV